MFSEWKTGFSRICIAALILSLFGMSGCRVMSESTQGTSLANIPSVDISCMQTVPSRLSAYFAGTLKDNSDIQGAIDCTSQALETFRTLTRGQSPNVYTASELQVFLNRYLPTNYQIPDSLRDQAMALKAGFFGGSGTQITNDELISVHGFFAILRDQAVAIKGLMPYSQAQAAATSPGDLAALLQAAEVAGAAFGAYFDNQGGSYSLASAAAFLQALQTYYSTAQGPQNTFATTLSWLREQLPMIGSAKRMLVGGSDAGFASGEWTRFLRTGAQVANIYFYVLNIVGTQSANGQPWMSDWGTSAMQGVFNYAIGVLTKIRTQLPAPVIPAAAVNDLLTNLIAMKNNNTLASQADAATMANAAAFAVLGKTAILGGSTLAIDLSSIESVQAFVAAARPSLLWAYQSFVTLDPLAATSAQIDAVVAAAPANLGAVGAAIATLKSTVGAIDDLTALGALATQLQPAFTDQAFASKAVQALAFGGAVKQTLVSDGSSMFIAPAQWNTIVGSTIPLVRSYFLARRLNLPGPPQEDPRITQARRMLDLAGELSKAIPLALGGQVDLSGFTAADLQALIGALPDSMAAVLFPGNLSQARAALENAATIAYKVKGAIFGGMPQSITKPDLQVVAKVTVALQAAVERLKGYIGIDYSDLSALSPDTVDGLVAAALQSVSELSTALGNLSGYPALAQADVVSMLQNLQAAFGGTGLQTAQQAVPLIFAAKGMVLGGGVATIGGTEWTGFLNHGSAWAGASFRFVHYLSQQANWDRGPSLARLVSIEPQLIAELSVSVQARPAVGSAPAVVPFVDFQNLIDAAYAWLGTQGVTPELTQPSAHAFIVPLIQRFLASYRTGLGGRQALGLTLDAVTYLDQAFGRWLLGQHLLIQAYTNLAGSDAGLVSQGYLRADLLSALAKAATDPSYSSTPALDASATLTQIMTLYRPLFLNRDSIMSFVYTGTAENYYSFDDVSRLFFYDGLIRIFIEAYSEDPTRAQNHVGVLETELANFVNDTEGLVIDLKIGAPGLTPQALAAQRFREAILFTSQSTGSQYFTRWEGDEYLGFLGSAGLITNAMYADMGANCPTDGLDTAGKPLIDMVCFRTRFSDPAYFQQYFNPYAPWLVSQYTGFSSAKRQQFIADLEVGARGTITNAPMDSFKAQSFMLLPLYIESLFKRYDVKVDGVLSLREGLAAYPVMCSTLMAASPFTDNCSKPNWKESDVGTLFGYLLVKGTTPATGGSTLWDKILAGINWVGWEAEWSVLWTFHIDDATYNADRGRLMSIVAALASSSASPAPTPAPSPAPTPAPTATPTPVAGGPHA